VYLVFKENFLIATLLKRGNKNVDIKFSAHEHFWNNLHQVAQNRKIAKPNNSIVFRAQDIWVLMLCRSFFTPGRYIGSAVFMVWVFGAVGDVVLLFHGEYGLTLLGMLDFCFVSAVICPTLLIGVTPVLSVPKDFIYNSFFHHILLKILTKI
jgi:hypothetical protein